MPVFVSREIFPRGWRQFIVVPIGWNVGIIKTLATLQQENFYTVLCQGNGCWKPSCSGSDNRNGKFLP
jgi:hypothetical protein